MSFMAKQNTRTNRPSFRNTKENSFNKSTDFQKSLTLSGELVKTNKSNADSFNQSLRMSTGPLQDEYIKSLQQQIYLLELENNHLRSQTVKATELHPVMADEAKRMMIELKTLQSKIDALEMENFRKEGAAEALQHRLDSLTSQLSKNQDMHSQEKDACYYELTDAKRERDLVKRDATRLELRLKEFEEEYHRKCEELKNAEAKVLKQRVQLEASMDQVAALETVLAEERTTIAKLEAKLKVLELEGSNSKTHIQERKITEYREEIIQLKEKLRLVSGQIDKESLLRTKTSEENGALIKENARLQQRLTELERQLDKERDNHSQWKQTIDIDKEDLIQLREREKTLNYQVARGVEEVATLRLKMESYITQLTELEQRTQNESLELNVARKRLYDLESSNKESQEKVHKLELEKKRLVEHVDSVQTQLHRKETEIETMELALKQTEQRLTDIQAEYSRSGQLQATRWSEIEKIADSMRSTAHTNSVLFDKN